MMKGSHRWSWWTEGSWENKGERQLWEGRHSFLGKAGCENSAGSHSRAGSLLVCSLEGGSGLGLVLCSSLEALMGMAVSF